MTDAISQYGRQNLSDNTVRSSADKVKKSSTSQSASSTGSTGSSERSAPASRGEDTVALSSVAQRAMAEPDFDRAKVEAIKQAISQGQYPLDSRRIAESFVAIERMIRE
jgi:negative regulator of flagellin synthesis FlgM